MLQLTSILVIFGLVSSAFELEALIRRPRSNMRDIARAIDDRKEPSDLVVMAPEWFAASFDHYFPPSVEQIDYPFEGRSSLINFSNIWEAREKSVAMRGLQVRLAAARKAGRRVWFVSERNYLRSYRPDELQKAYRNRMPAFFTLRDIRLIRATLETLYGPPRLVLSTRPTPVHDDMRGLLFAPSAGSTQ